MMAGRRDGRRTGRGRGALTAAAALAVLAGPAAARDPVRVAADIAPVQSLAAMVMQGAGIPALIVPPGASPHGYALRPSQARALQEAEIVFRVGPGLTPWLEEAITDLAANAVAVTLAEVPGVAHLTIREDAMFAPEAETHEHDDDEHGPEKHGHDDHDGDAHHADHDDDGDDDHEGHEGHHHAAGSDDPHLWLNPDNALVWIDAMEAALSEADPERADLYEANADAARARISAAAEQAEATLAPVHGRAYAVFHDAYAHFERRFDLPALGALSLGDGAKPGARHLTELRDRLIEAHAACVFSEPQFPPRLVAAITEGTGIRHAELDPLGAGLDPGPTLYPALIEGMAMSMADCLDG